MTERTFSHVEALFEDAARTFLDSMPDDLVAETRALIALDPTAMGVRVHRNEREDLYDLTWVGRHLGSIGGDLVRAAARRDAAEGRTVSGDG